ncbi:hypothetical protein ACF3NG_01595 [Aerococcaceae bacterium WGS1372]
MIKEFISARLQMVTVDPFTEKKTTISLNDLTEDASYDTVVSVRDAIANLIDEPITSTQAVHTYSFA